MKNAKLLVVDVVKATLGPRGMDKILVDTIGDVTISNDGHGILNQWPADSYPKRSGRQKKKSQGSRPLVAF